VTETTLNSISIFKVSFKNLSFLRFASFSPTSASRRWSEISVLMPKKKKKKLLRGVVTSSSKFAAVCARAASSVSSGVRDGSSGVASVFGVFGNLDFSDHVSCGVVLEADGISVKRPFKFYNFLLNNEEFLNVVIENWYSTNVVGSHMFRVSKKLKALKKPIKDFSRLNYSGIELRTKEAHEWFLRRQDLTLANASDLNAALELEAQRKWLLLSSAEESFFHQRSRVSWFAEGDSNTSYFHRMADSRKCFNPIKSLVDCNGVVIDSQQGIIDHCMAYYERLLGEVETPFSLEQDDMNLLLTYRCSQAQSTEM